MPADRAQILAPHPPYDQDPAIREAADLLRAGELVAFPTETVYGLGADATSTAAVERIYQVKGRPLDNPAIVHVGHNEDILRIGAVDDPRIVALFKRFWPGSLTMVIPALEPYRTTIGRGRDTIAVRMPGHPIALALLHAVGVPLAAPSANRSGRPSPTSAQHVFDDLGADIPLILDGGPCMVGIESTVVDLSGGPVRILRPGAITAAEIASVLGEAVVIASIEDLAKSPGTHYPHYQPTAPVVVVELSTPEAALRQIIAERQRAAGRGLRVGYIARAERPLGLPPGNIEWRFARHAEALTRNFYAYLRDLDSAGVDLILVDAVGEQEGVMDRLRRAAQPSG